MLSISLIKYMAKVGYIFMAEHCDMLEADKEWMLQYGCIQVFEESTDHEFASFMEATDGQYWERR